MATPSSILTEGALRSGRHNVHQLSEAFAWAALPFFILPRFDFVVFSATTVGRRLRKCICTLAPNFFAAVGTHKCNPQTWQFHVCSFGSAWYSARPSIGTSFARCLSQCVLTSSGAVAYRALWDRKGPIPYSALAALGARESKKKHRGSTATPLGWALGHHCSCPAKLTILTLLLSSRINWPLYQLAWGLKRGVLEASRPRKA